MEELTRFDLVFWSQGNGWSEAALRIGDQPERLVVSHVPTNPHEAIARATAELVEGSDSAAFQWFDEPGTYAFDLRREGRSPLLHGTFREFRELHPHGIPRDASPRRTLEFMTNLDYWVALVHASLARSAALSRHRAYASWNGVEIPGRELAVLEKYLHRGRRADD